MPNNCRQPDEMFMCRSNDEKDIHGVTENTEDIVRATDNYIFCTHYKLRQINLFETIRQKNVLGTLSFFGVLAWDIFNQDLAFKIILKLCKKL